MSCGIELSLFMGELQSHGFRSTVFLVFPSKVNRFSLIAFLVGAKIRNDPLVVQGLPFRVEDVHSFGFLDVLKPLFIRQRGQVLLFSRVFEHELVFLVG